MKKPKFGYCFSINLLMLCCALSPSVTAAAIFESTAQINLYTDGVLQLTAPTMVYNAFVSGSDYGPEYQRARSGYFEGVREGTANDSYLGIEIESTTVSDSRRALALYFDLYNYEPDYEMVEVIASTFWQDTFVNNTGSEKNYRFDFWVSLTPPSNTLPGVDADESMQVHLNGVLIWDYFTALPALQEDAGQQDQANVVLNLGNLDVGSSFELTYTSSRIVQWSLDYSIPYGNGYDDASSGNPHYYYPGNEITVHPVPVPAAISLLFSALGFLGFIGRRSRL